MYMQATKTPRKEPPKFQEDSKVVPKAFQDQLAKLRAEKILKSQVGL